MTPFCISKTGSLNYEGTHSLLALPQIQPARLRVYIVLLINSHIIIIIIIIIIAFYYLGE